MDTVLSHHHSISEWNQGLSYVFFWWLENLVKLPSLGLGDWQQDWPVVSSPSLDSAREGNLLPHSSEQRMMTAITVILIRKELCDLVSR